MEDYQPGIRIKNSPYASQLMPKALQPECDENGNMHMYLEQLQMMREELVSVRIVLLNEEYVPVIIRSVPTYYATFLAHLTMSADLLGHRIQPEKLILLLAQEYDCLNPP